MRHYDAADVRTFALLGHGGTGKTTLGEAVLFLAGGNTRQGRVEDGSSVLDAEPEEKEKGHSLSIHFLTVEWGEKRIHAVDTPGDGDFIYEAQAALLGVDAAVVVVSAVDGVEVQTEKTWSFAEAAAVPRVVFINKMDRERANPEGALESMRERLGVKGVPVQWPIGVEAGFRGVVDLITQEAWFFSTDGSGKVSRGSIPDSVKDEVRAATEVLMDAAASADDVLIEHFLEHGELTPEEVRKGLARGIAMGSLIPVLYGAASLNQGVRSLLDFASLLPSGMEAPLRTGVGREGEVLVTPDPSAPLVAQVIKTLHDPFAGKVSVMRVLTGTMAQDQGAWNARKGVRERWGHIHFMKGRKQEAVDRAGPGDLVSVAKLKETATFDTLSDEKRPVELSTPSLPAPMMSYVIRARSKGDEDKVKIAIHKLMDEDPTLHTGHDELTRDLVLSGVGQGHVEMNVKRLKRKYGVDVELDLPLVPYKETAKASVKAQGRHKKQTGGRGQFGDTWLRIEPLPRGQGFQFEDEVVGGAVPRQFIPAVEKGLRETMARGVLAGYPVVDVKVALYDGSSHPVDSSEMAFKMAASKGFKKGFMEARPILLEPIQDMEISVPEDSVGEVMGDINGRRGRVITLENRGRNAVVKAQIPLAEVLTYAQDLRSMTGGKGAFTMAFAHHEEVPAHLQSKLIAESRRKVEEEED